MITYIYKLTCKANGKVYIGQSKNHEKRWASGNGYHRQKKMFPDIQKYGWEGFDHEIIGEAKTYEEADEMEKEAIAKYDAIENGYNTEIGGNTRHDCPEVAMANHNKPRRGCKQRPEAVAKMRATQKGKHWSPQTEIKKGTCRGDSLTAIERLRWHRRQDDGRPLGFKSREAETTQSLWRARSAWHRPQRNPDDHR